MHKTKRCKCNQCYYNKILAKYIPKSEKKFWKIADEFDVELLDSSVNKAILDGTWPSAVEQLEKALFLAQMNRRLAMLGE